MEKLSRRFYRDYLCRVDGRAILDHYGAQNCTEKFGSDGTIEIIHSCLLDRLYPHHSNGDSIPSASLNIDKRLYVCYSLGWGGDLLNLLARLEGKDMVVDVLPMVGPFLSGAVRDIEVFKSELEKLLADVKIITVELPVYSEHVLDSWINSHNSYWEQRGISLDAISKLKLGYDCSERRIVFPHFFNYSLVGWQKRVTPESNPSWPKYRSSLGFPRSETLYNYDIASQYRQGVVVESPMSVARAFTLGLSNVMATFGSKISSHQIDLLKGFDAIKIWFDADPAGRAGERQLVKELYRHTDVQVVIPEKGKDMADVVDDRHLYSRLLSAVPAALRLALYDEEKKQWATKG